MAEIETERLRLRMYRTEDADDQLRIMTGPGFGRHMPPQFQPTRDRVLVGIGRILEHWNLRGHGQWAMELKEDGRMVGYCGLRYLPDTQEVELLYGIDTSLWHKGLTTEAARAALRYGFEERKFGRIMAVTVPENTGSRRVMEKSGMKYEKEAFYFNVNCLYYALERDDYRTDDAPYALRP